MVIKKISILNYKNIAESELTFSHKINCFVGHNGEGKTNVLDAIYYLSFCKSATNPIDSQLMRHDQDFFMLQAAYEFENGDEEQIYCGMKRRQKKRVKRGPKEYKRLSEHIGFAPLVMISPADSELISGGSDGRRRFMDLVISQYDQDYLASLVYYNRALEQRNALLKQGDPVDEQLLSVTEEQMGFYGEKIFAKRDEYVREFIPVFQRYHEHISMGHERVELNYVSHCQRGPLVDVIRAGRGKDVIMGYSLHGVHKDDLEMTLQGFPIKKEGSQGQNKTFLIALKLAQFDFLHRKGTGTTPLLLMDDIFDKLDASRVEQIMHLVSSDDFGQIFITDTNRDHLDTILAQSHLSYKLFKVEKGEIHDI